MSAQNSSKTYRIWMGLLMKTILFLDFDGVLHPFFPRSDLSDAENQKWSYVPNFEAVIRDFPDVDIVISSTWRIEHPLDELRSHFSSDIASRIIGVNPTLPNHRPHEDGGRQPECEAWLVQNNKTHLPWLAVDDMVDLFTPGCAVVVAQDGFKERDSERLRQALVNPRAWAVSNPVPNRNRNLGKTHIILPPGVTL